MTEFSASHPGFAHARRRRIRMTAMACLAFAGTMLGVAFAAAPLYDLFCKVTGFGGMPLRAASAPQAPIGERQLTIRFDANTNGLPWRFAPEVDATTIRTGETRTIYYRVTNTAKVPVTGVATFNVEPPLAAAYFVKVQCFCFTDTVIEPGETQTLPIVFYIDRDIEKDRDLARLSTMTLSYTFFPAAPKARSTSELSKPRS
jgi:cytochrome c oxidase assembly protein subunit 11